MVSLRYLKKSGAKSNDHVYVRCNQSKIKIHIDFFSNLRFRPGRTNSGRGFTGHGYQTGDRQRVIAINTSEPKIEKEETG